jgi:hypothetical protein
VSASRPVLPPSLALRLRYSFHFYLFLSGKRVNNFDFAKQPEDAAEAVAAAAAAVESVRTQPAETPVSTPSGLSINTSPDIVSSDHGDSGKGDASHLKKSDRIRELEQEVFELKKRLERSESRVVS